MSNRTGVALFVVFVMYCTIGVVAALADARGEVEHNMCHVPWDPNNTDNEEFISGCFDKTNLGQINNQANLKFSVFRSPSSAVPNPGGYIRLHGSGWPQEHPDSQEVAGSNCALVTSNYDAGAQTQNRTERTTDNWRVIIHPIKRGSRGKRLFHLECRNAN